MPADANRVGIKYRQMTGFDDLGSATIKDLRFTSESLKQTTDSASSDEIRSDRQRSDLIRTDVRAEGDINFELSYAEYDPFLVAALQSATWSSSDTAMATAEAVTFTASSKTIDKDGGDWDNQPKVGDLIKVSGAAAANNNGVFTVETVPDGTSVTVKETTITDESGTTVTVVKGDLIKNGTSEVFFAIQKDYNDVDGSTDLYDYFDNMVVDSMNLTIEPGSILTGGFSFMGSTATSADTLGSATASTTNPVANAVDNVPLVSEAQAAITGVTQISLSVGNNTRARSEIGRLGSAEPGSGTIDVTGTLQMYLASDDQIDKYLDWTTTSLCFAVKDSDGNGYTFCLPEVKFTDGQRLAGGINTDVIAELSFTAYADADDGTIQIHRATD